MCIEHREESWGQLQVKAFRLLEHTPSPGNGLIFPVMRLWEFPSFGRPYASWTVFRTQQAIAFAVRELTWRRSDDHKRLCSDRLEGLKKGYSTDPTVNIRGASLESKALNAYVETAERFHLPVLKLDKRIALDGTRYGLQTYDSLNTVSISWWESGPAEWHELTEWASRLRRFLIEMLDNSGNE